MVEIVKGRPLPERKPGGKKAASAYPFAAMEIGDSFSVPNDKGLNKSGSGSAAQRMIASYAANYSRRTGSERKFTTRLIGDEVVCWRIA